jgi:hypothetical protein
MFKPGDKISHPTWGWGDTSYTVVSCEEMVRMGGEKYLRCVMYKVGQAEYSKFDWDCGEHFARDLFLIPVSSAVERKIAMMWSRQPYVKQAMSKV